MKKIMILLTIFGSIGVFAKNPKDEDKIDGTKMSFKERLALKNQISTQKRTESIPVEVQSESFIETLKEKGSEGVPVVKSLIKGADKEMIEREKGNEPTGSEFDKLTEALQAKDGKIKEYKQINKEEKLNGTLIKVNYLIEYENGNTQEVQFIYVKPDISGGLKLMDFYVK